MTCKRRFSDTKFCLQNPSSSCDPPCCLAGFWCGHTNWRCKLLVSGGVTRGRVARDVREGTTSQKDMTSRAQAQKQPKAGPKTGTATGREASLQSED